MKKTCLILLMILLLAPAGMGVISLALRSGSAKQEQAATPPEFTRETLLSGTFFSDVDAYYTRVFPFRPELLRANREMNRFYFYGAGEENLLSIAYDGSAEKGGAAPIPSGSVPKVTFSAPKKPTPAKQKPAEAATAEPHLPLPQQADAAIGTILICGNRAMEIPTADWSVIGQYGAAVNEIRRCAEEDCRVFSLLTPNSGQFYSPVSHHTELHDQKEMIRRAYEAMEDPIQCVDVYKEIAAHTEEYVFFRTDHHWTQKGAYYAYRAFAQAAGFTPSELESYETGSYDTFVGSLYQFTSGYPQSRVLQEQPDHLTYYLPKVSAKACYYRTAEMENSFSVPLIDMDFPEKTENKYMCFLGGDAPISEIRSESEGGTCLLIKDSYSNALIPFLAEHYSRILAIDPREFNHDEKPVLHLREFLQGKEIGDILIVNYPFMMNSPTYISYLSALTRN